MNPFTLDLADLLVGMVNITLYCAPSEHTSTGWRFTAYLHFPTPPNTPGMCYASKSYRLETPAEAIKDALDHVYEMEQILSATLAKINSVI